MFVTNIHAYDCLDTVVYTAQVRAYDRDQQGGNEQVLDLRGSFPGRGEDSPELYLRELLTEMLRAL